MTYYFKKWKIIGLVLLSLILSACGNDIVENKSKKDPQKYEQAIIGVQGTKLNEDGTYSVTEDLIIALENEEFIEAKSVIYMIGDGMGANIIELAEDYYAKSLYQHTLAMNYLPLQGRQSTYSANEDVTDSAAGGTALATGYKTNNGVISMDTECSVKYKTVLELAAEKGKSTGIIATKTVTDATPASFTAHVSSREEMITIAQQQLEKVADKELDIILGGGYYYYEDVNSKEMFEKAKNSGMSYSTNWEQVQGKELPMVGLFAEENMDTTDDTLPTLAEMTELALSKLSTDKNGFFLMVEGSQIDTKAHANDLEREREELYHFDQAVGIAMRYVALHPETVLIITADHETGGLNVSDGEYSTTSHTACSVPVYAIGYRTEELDKIKENTDIASFVASLMGEDEFGQESILHTVFDGEKKEHRKVLVKENENMSNENNYIEITFSRKGNQSTIPMENLEFEGSNVKNCRVLYLVLENRGDEAVKAPAVHMVFNAQTNQTLMEKFTYLQPGEKSVVTYVIPKEGWQDYSCANLENFTLFYNTSDEIKLKLYDAVIADRALED